MFVGPGDCVDGEAAGRGDEVAVTSYTSVAGSVRSVSCAFV
jgi:hypothetical protein